MNERDSFEMLEQRAPIEDRDECLRAMLGAVILGVLDHVGTEDLQRWKLDTVDSVTIGRLRTVLSKGDKGLHGCGFEYAVHAALNHDTRIPDSIRGIVTTTVASEVGVQFERLGVPQAGWSQELRAIMVGGERRSRQKQPRDFAYPHGPEYHHFEVSVGEEIGRGALIWGSREGGPYALWNLLPDLTCAGFRSASDRTFTYARRGRHRLPPDISRLWQADLLVGGADVERTSDVQRALRLLDPPFLGRPTAWVAVTVKYPSGRAEPGPGIHLAIETAHGASQKASASRRFVIAGEPDLLGVRLPLDGDFVQLFNTAYSLITMWAWKGTQRAHPRDVPESAHRRLYSFLAGSRSRKAQQLGEDLLRYPNASMPALELGTRLAETARTDLVERVDAPGTAPRSLHHTTLTPMPAQVAA